MLPEDLTNEMEILIRSHYGFILLETIEQERAEKLLGQLANRMDLPLFYWASHQGLFRPGTKNTIYGTAPLTGALAHIGISGLQAIYYFQGMAPFLEDQGVLSQLTLTVRNLAEIGATMVVTGQNIHVPDVMKPHTAVLRLPLPGREELKDLLKNIYHDISRKTRIAVEMDQEDLKRLVQNLQGLTLVEAKKILTKVMIEDGKLSPKDIQKVIEAKKAVIEKEGLLEYYPVNERLQDVADLEGLKAWLAKRSHFITHPEKAKQAGLKFPRGVLLLGVPGTGKSLCAKAVAMEWGLPLLKMDPANLYSKYIGETEQKFKRAMEMAEKMAPLVLWVDEIEKALASGGNEDGGVSMRVLGTFLSWMQDRRGDVFVVATANDISRLPPELLRKGRFDEIFFVDLPGGETRKTIFRIHISRRGHQSDKFDLDQLAAVSDGFSGAEIEQVVVSALYTCVSDGFDLSTALLVEEAKKTCPLSKTRFEYVQELRQWAENRTVKAN